MAIAYVNKVISGTNSSGTTSSAIDTTGANFIAVGVASYALAGQPTLSDSKGNTWTGLTATESGANRIRIFYCESPTVGSGHTFTASGATSYATISVLAFSGVGASSVDQQSGAASTAPGSVTPSQDNELLTAFMIVDTPGSPAAVSVNSSFTLANDIPNSSGNYFGLAAAYQIQTTATARNPTFSFTGSGNAATRIATFKEDSGGGGGSSTPYYAILQSQPQRRFARS